MCRYTEIIFIMKIVCFFLDDHTESALRKINPKYFLSRPAGTSQKDVVLAGLTRRSGELIDFLIESLLIILSF